MPDRTRKRTSKRARHTAVHGLGAILFGVLFLAMGVFGMLLSAGTVRSNPWFERTLRLRWFAGSGGCLFAAFSILATIEGVRGMLWQRRKTRILASHPGAAWLADYRWNEKGEADRVLSRATRNFLADTIRIEGSAARSLAGRSVPVSFSLPMAARPTKLADKPPVYWEVEIIADNPGVDYKAAFLVPVYSKT